MTASINVAILENHPLVVLVLQEQIRAALPEVNVTYAGDQVSMAAEAVEAGTRLIVMDIDLGDDVDTKEAVALLISRGAQIILTSAHDHAASLKALIELGTFAFIPKRMIAKQLDSAIRHLDIGTRWLSPEFAGALAQCHAEDGTIHEELSLYGGGLTLAALARRRSETEGAVWQLLLGQAFGS